MVALVHDEGVLGDGLGVDFVGVEEVDEFGLRGGGVLGGGEADIVGRSSGGNLRATVRLLKPDLNE